MTGQSEISALVRKLQKAYSKTDNSSKASSTIVTSKKSNTSDHSVGLFDETEAFDGPDDINFDAEGDDDFDIGEELDNDDEEEEVHILNGEEGDEDDENDYDGKTLQSSPGIDFDIFIFAVYVL